MMHAINCPIKDVSATELGVLWNAPLPQEILAERHLHHGSSHIHLGVIGASHVVSIYASPSELLFREEISCTARKLGQPLPTKVQQENYQLTSSIQRFASHTFTEQATQIAQDDSMALMVRFPGHGQFHITALTATAAEHGWEWTTHHLYPTENTIVTTWSTFQL